AGAAQVPAPRGVNAGTCHRGRGVAGVRRNREGAAMLRRLIAVTALAAGLSVAAAMTLATPALAKGPSQARITGPGLVRAVVVSGAGEPGQQGRLASLAEQTGLFTVMFGGGGADVAGPDPAGLRTPPPQASPRP